MYCKLSYFLLNILNLNFTNSFFRFPFSFFKTLYRNTSKKTLPDSLAWELVKEYGASEREWIEHLF